MAKSKGRRLTTQQVADELGIGKRMVQVYIKSGRLPAEKIGRDWFVWEADIEPLRIRKMGPPFGWSKKKKKAA